MVRFQSRPRNAVIFLGINGGIGLIGRKSRQYTALKVPVIFIWRECVSAKEPIVVLSKQKVIHYLLRIAMVMAIEKSIA